MKRTVSVLLVLVLALAEPALALVEGRQVMYVGGTVAGVKEGAIGAFDTTNVESLVFEVAGSKLQIPYSAVQRFWVSEELARRMGVVSTLVVVMLKHRRRRHFVEIHFADSAGQNQAAIFEVSKDMSKTIHAVLRARVPQPKR